MEGTTGGVTSLMLNLTSLSRRRELRVFRSAGRAVTGVEVIHVWAVEKHNLHFPRFITTQFKLFG